VSYFLVLQTRRDPGVSQAGVSMAWAVLALGLLLLWQFLTVHYVRGGNWTALFLTGADSGIPPDLSPGTYKFPGPGYDGEMYRYVAHDLFMQRGYLKYVDGPAQRYHRILVPALAYLLVAGHQQWIDASYIGVIAIFVLLGAYWFSRWAASVGRHPAWALGFLLVPATLISMDRMTVDVALAAFTVAFAFYWRTEAWTKLFVVLVLACLVRETGVFLAGGCCLVELISRRWVRAVIWASTALPALVWYLFVRRLLPEKTHFGVPTWVAHKLGAGIFHKILHPPDYPLSGLLDTFARWGDVFSLTAIVLGSLLAILLLRVRPFNPLAIAAVMFAALVFVLTASGYWNDVNGYARVFSPLLLLVALGSTVEQSDVPWWTGLVPAILVDLRLSMEFASAAGDVVRGLLRS
jgi:energy-converting hydrogenase Eha subunit C